MDNKTGQETKKIGIRSAPDFGFTLANNFVEELGKDKIPPSQWPIRFPLTLKKIREMPEVNGNDKVAKKISEAAKVIWRDMREHALSIEQDMMLHPENYHELHETFQNHEDYLRSCAWRHLSSNIEQIAGNVFITEYLEEEAAKENVYLMLSANRLKKHIVDFEDDYKNFIDEVREAIRAKKQIRATIRLELICMLNTNTMSAKKSLARQKA